MSLKFQTFFFDIKKEKSFYQRKSNISIIGYMGCTRLISQPMPWTRHKPIKYNSKFQLVGLSPQIRHKPIKYNLKFQLVGPLICYYCPILINSNVNVYTCGVNTQKIRLQKPHKTKGPRGVQLQSKQQIRRREKRKRKKKKGNEQTKLKEER